MRHQLQEEYPQSQCSYIKCPLQKENCEAYNLDSEDNEIAEEGKMLFRG